MTKMTPAVKEVLSWYESDNPGTKANLARILMHGKLGGTGKVVILPVDQGFEHGPARSFAPNEAGYDPHYHFQLAIDAGMSAFAAPLGMLEAGASTFAGQVPLILKMNSANALTNPNLPPNQAVTASVDDALRLGCSAVGFTMYPGSDCMYDMMEEIREISCEAKSAGLAVVLWSYARGSVISKAGETAIDVIAYAAHMAALMGAHIIKVKPPKAFMEQDKAASALNDANMDFSELSDRISYIMKSAFDGRRLVVFSGGDAKGTDDVLAEIKQIAAGGGSGSIIGRNSFQREKSDALDLLSKIMDIYKNT